jgi:hypothetical protein
VPVDMYSTIFDLGGTDGDTILGFNNELLHNFDILDEYNALDFSEQTQIKYISGSCQFNRRIFNK